MENRVNGGCRKHPIRWLTVEDIRKQQRIRREAVIAAMLCGDLPYEQRGKIRYARCCDVEQWELKRLTKPRAPIKLRIHPELRDLI